MSSFDNVQAAIRELVEKQTFTAEAAAGITKLRADVDAAVKENKDLLTRNEKLQQDNLGLGRTIGLRDAELAVVKAREEALVKREAACHVAEIEKATANATASTFRECFGAVFRNFQVHRTLTEQAVHPRAGHQQGGGWNPDTISTTKTETEATV
jgi:hypothetical protein